jgi:hypothetical protein
VEWGWGAAAPPDSGIIVHGLTSGVAGSRGGAGGAGVCAGGFERCGALVLFLEDILLTSCYEDLNAIAKDVEDIAFNDFNSCVCDESTLRLSLKLVLGCGQEVGKGFVGVST